MENAKKIAPRIFYSVTVTDANIQGILDAIKFIANPNSKSPAHITVKGPMRNKLSKSDFKRYDASIADGKIHVLQVGAFKNSDRFTVYIEVEKTDTIQKLWYKPDFPDGTPHITIYDGPKTSFSTWLLAELSNFDWDFVLPVGIKFEEFTKTPSLLHLGNLREVLADAALGGGFMDSKAQETVPENWDENLRKNVIANLIGQLNSKLQATAA
jgi:hypothetical protein